MAPPHGQRTHPPSTAESRTITGPIHRHTDMQCAHRRPERIGPRTTMGPLPSHAKRGYVLVVFKDSVLNAKDQLKPEGVHEA
eukprot:1839711-Rhodomonas_salina.4